MPRPNAAQLAYGSATVICSTLAMLLLSGTTSGIGVAVIGLAALALGLLVAVTVPMPRRTAAAQEPATAVGSMGAPAGTHSRASAPAPSLRAPVAATAQPQSVRR